LNYLKKLPIQQLKIDRAYLQDIYQHNDYTIDKTIISMAKTLSLQVVAEGVETELQLNMLKDLKCTHVQGYYFYKPVPAEQLIALLTTK
ncbi:MAG: EAL domain-containing protein, partial [Lysinibacillus sp.]